MSIQLKLTTGVPYIGMHVRRGAKWKEAAFVDVDKYVVAARDHVKVDTKDIYLFVLLLYWQICHIIANAACQSEWIARTSRRVFGN